MFTNPIQQALETFQNSLSKLEFKGSFNDQTPSDLREVSKLLLQLGSIFDSCIETIGDVAESNEDWCNISQDSIKHGICYLLNETANDLEQNDSSDDY